MSDIHRYTAVDVAVPATTPGGDEIPGATKTIQVLDSNAGSVGGKHGQMRFCAVCAYEFREDQMIMFRGRWYCKPNLHIKQIASILKLEAAERYRPSNANERPGPGLIIG